VAAQYREHAEGEQTAREEVVDRGNLEDDGVAATELCRGAKGQERIAQVIY